MNWAIAAGLGLAIGLFAPSLVHLPKSIQVGLFALFTVFWIVGTLGLAARMKHEADAMELLWVCARLEPSLKEMISKAVCTEDIMSAEALVSNTMLSNNEAGLSSMSPPPV